MSSKKYISINLDNYSTCNTTYKNAFIFYVTLLAKFNNNTFYNTSNAKLAHLTGLNRNTISLYLNILQKLDLIQWSNKDLILKVQSKQAKTKYYKMHLYRSSKFKHIKLIINIKLIKIHLSQQRFKELNKLPNYLKTNRKVKKIRENLIGGKIFTSTRSLAKVLNVSHNTINIFLHKAKSKKMLNYKFNLKLLVNNVSLIDFLNIKRTNPDYFYIYNSGNVYLHCGVKFSYLL